MEHLTLADEIVVLMLDDETGAIKPSCVGFANLAIAGGILMELALLGRIDTDLKSLYVVDPNPVGDEILDGRHRYFAAREAGVPYPVVQFLEGDAVAFVVASAIAMAPFWRWWAIRAQRWPRENCPGVP